MWNQAGWIDFDAATDAAGDREKPELSRNAQSNRQQHRPADSNFYRPDAEALKDARNSCCVLMRLLRWCHSELLALAVAVAVVWVAAVEVIIIIRR